MKHLIDKVALVTGAGSGIGRAVALHLARSGCHLILNDVDDRKVTPLCEAIRMIGRRAVIACADVSVLCEVEAMVQVALNEMGRVDILVNNAGVGLGGTMAQISVKNWEWIMGINMWGHIYTTRTVLPQMLSRCEGHLVHIASAAGLVGMGNMLPYAASKFAVVGVAESLAAQLRSKGIGVTVVCPANVRTNLCDVARFDFPSRAERSDNVAAIRYFNDVGIPPEKVAKSVVRAIERNRFLVMTHWYTRPLYIFKALFPETALRVIGWLEKIMSQRYAKAWKRRQLDSVSTSKLS